MTADRKNEAREKFLLGGLVVRAGLTRADCAFLIGGLLELARVAPNSPPATVDIVSPPQNNVARHLATTE
ncbi:conjugal transfer protein TraD [Sinorhizobium meliloti]|uniref:conjugal transfer protein TraD n=1 Tax=Rhizobium meliloti TaxID=382 RepID=UPI000FD2C0C2|nr:conjugal transfer protein TraD [Sinorhizobium meliloti]RVO87670.1 hypothetical protein CN089_31635 [Sinorhizobium meliloti]RVP85838.1 hypothetical protein CN096_35265 [Sinorhizobium meliloti]RVR10341.1 hypothetical protein CN243_11430 [Sinorhizobium meliloti]